jgi:hypothetical protein
MQRLWIAIVTVTACWSSPAPEPPPTPDPTPQAKPVSSKRGTFRIPHAERIRRGATTIAVPGIERFHYDGVHVTVSLFTEKAWMWRRPDDIYRLDSRWQGNELQYRPPFGTWTRLAVFQTDHYMLPDDDKPWVFERVSDAMKDADDRMLDADRPPHDYAIKPLDPYTP